MVFVPLRRSCHRTLHLIEQACATTTRLVRLRTQGACSSLPPALQPTTYMQNGLCAFATEPPSNTPKPAQSSLRLLLGARRRRTQVACSFLPSPAGTPGTHLQDVCDCLATEPPFHASPDRASLRSCSSVEAEADARCVLVSAAGTLATHLQVRLPLRRSRHRTLLHLLKQACATPRCEADSSCVLVSAAGTLVKSAACRQDQALALAGALPLQRSRHAAPTDRWIDQASLRLLHGARRRWSQGACSSLPLAL